MAGYEPRTSGIGRKCSATEPHPLPIKINPLFDEKFAKIEIDLKISSFHSSSLISFQEREKN